MYITYKIFDCWWLLWSIIKTWLIAHFPLIAGLKVPAIRGASAFTFFVVACLFVCLSYFYNTSSEKTSKVGLCYCFVSYLKTLNHCQIKCVRFIFILNYRWIMMGHDFWTIKDTLYNTVQYTMYRIVHC